MTSNYSPELDGTPELDSDGVTRFQELIGILQVLIKAAHNQQFFIPFPINLSCFSQQWGENDSENQYFMNSQTKSK